jgi:inosine-uridine nucleoside N-ribohydrolase
MMDAIIDTDPGHDDALAIMLAVKSNKFKIHMISTVAGNSTIENTTRNARHILKLLEKEDIPVFSGAEKPLKKELIQAVVHGKSGLEGLDPWTEPGLTGDAAEKMISLIKNNPFKIVLITLGPLTNIATAILKDPETMSKVKEIFIMGGAIKVPGNKFGVSEFNMFVDPDAADIVFSFGVKKTLVPLDACNHVTLQIKDFEKLHGSKLYLPIKSMIEPYIKNIYEDLQVKGALMYDPLTVYAIINPSACVPAIYNIKVDTSEEKRGKMVYEPRERMQEKRDIIVIEHISKDSFKNDFVDIMKG